MKKIDVNSPACIGAGMCTAAAPAVFDLGEDGLVVLNDPSGDVPDDMAESVDNAIAVCPAQAIRWRE